MTALVGYLLLFVLVGVGFIFIHLVAGKLIRPAKPEPEKLTIYECGEPTIGTAWVQFDLRFYVVALLFVIFDVEVAFFFPWAVVFGKANTLANPDISVSQRQELTGQLEPQYQARRELLRQQEEELTRSPNDPAAAAQLIEVRRQLADLDAQVAANAGPAHTFAWLAFWDILVFFGVLLVGFAYLWRRGDLVWVRSTAAERRGPAAAPGVPAEAPAQFLVGAGRGG
jgi:NADH-quinone oxidoreductase subunit A